MTFSISRKILAMAVGIASAGIIASAYVLYWNHRRGEHQSLADQTQSLAAIVAENLIGPLAFDDPDGAQEILRTLGKHPHVVAAAAVNRLGVLVAVHSSPPLAPWKDMVRGDHFMPRLDATRFEYAHEPVRHAGGTIGAAHVLVSRSGVDAVLRQNRLFIMALCLGSILVCALLAARLQRFVTGPILELANAMERVGRGGELSMRVRPRSTDEMGILFRGFNFMLDQLHERAAERDRSQQRLRGLVATLPDVVYVLDEEGHCTEILAGNASLLTQPAESLIGQSVDAVFGTDAAPSVREAIDEVLARGWDPADGHHKGPVRVIYQQQVNARSVWFETVLVALPQTGPTERHLVLAVARDVTERRSLEERLHHAQKMQAVGELAGGVAHDFNNVLAVIVGFAEILRLSSDLSQEDREATDMILDAGRRASSLVSKLMVFSRRSGGQLLRTDLNKVVENVCEMLAPTINPKIHLRRDLAEQACAVKGDPSQLESAVLNLALNARDALPDGGVITFRTQRRSIDEATLRTRAPDFAHGERVVELEITDDGCGMPPDVRARIFEPFFTTKPLGKGTGLGLAAVYGTVTGHGGHIAVHSQVGRGTSFWLLFREAPDAPQVAATVTRTAPGGSHRILLVDDEPAIRAAASCMLRDLGYDVTTAANGRDGVEQWERARGGFDLVMLDVMMPDMGGPEAAAKMQRQDPHVRILFASGYGDQHEGSSEENTTRSFLAKPYSREELARKVAEVLGNEPSQSETTVPGTVPRDTHVSE